MLQEPQLSDSTLQAVTSPVAGLSAYLAVVLAAVFLNAADVYFMQTEKAPPLHKSPSFWLYMSGHIGVALLAAYLLYEKSGIAASNWPIVAAIASLAGFSVLQSLTLKFGDKGIDARELFDVWKRRVIQDIAKANASDKRARIIKVSRALAAKVSGNPAQLEPIIHQLAPEVQLDPLILIADWKRPGQDTALLMSQWIAGVDLELATRLLE